MPSNENYTHVLVRDFILPARIGIYEKEHQFPQSVRFNVDMQLTDYRVRHDRIEDTVSYEGIVNKIRELCQIHHELVEKLADHVANFCLEDSRVGVVTVMVEKLEIFPEGPVGTKIVRTRG
ncbi:MAG TPA: dihydroneopterin aldolase [Alphaproteobacteria bacterium]|nr:dihydroneopterin aldolase [Alphaproteobacteria bacterium]HNS44846.1 dihydroneopterin aldolase [Alphaproteobacteria bacterium]